MLEHDYKLLTKGFEGLRLKPYKCTAGKLTIGYGRNLDDIGINKEEADIMFDRDWDNACDVAKRLCEENDIDFEHLHKDRFYVLTDMCFNLGYSGTSKFKKMLYALKNGLYDDAANEMLNSLWAKQVGNRAIKLSTLMRG